MFCLILLYKMRQNIAHSKFSFAAEGGGILFTHPQDFQDSHCLSFYYVRIN